MKLKNKLPDLKNAFGTLELYATDPEKQRELEERLRSDENFAYEMAAKYELGVEEGIERGIEKGKLETARKMNEDGFSIEQILRITGLSLDDLKKNGIL
jgi:predicted transposase/invertase (TIGR01784 family)